MTFVTKSPPGQSDLSSSNRVIVKSRAPATHPVIEAYRDSLERRGFAFGSGEEMSQAVDPQVLDFIRVAQQAGHEAPIDPNNGGAEAGRYRYYQNALLCPRAADDERLVLLPPNFDQQSGRRYTTYLQPPGLNRDYAAERKFQPFPPTLLAHPGLTKLVCAVRQAHSESLFPNGYRDWEKVGLHLIRLDANGARPGISSPNRVHVDGEILTTVILLERVNVVGGVSLVTDRLYADTHPDEVPLESRLAELTLENPFDWLSVCDRRVAHYVSPVFARKNGHGWRSVLLVDFTPLRAMTSESLLDIE